jgi:polyphenol oxidase
VTAPAETFPALSAHPGIVHAFLGRVPGVDVKADRAVAMGRLESSHARALERLGFGGHCLITAQQVHGAEVAIVDASTSIPVPAVDGLITADTRACLGIHVADCGPVYLFDPKRHVAALLHSGRKGTESGITRVAIESMVEKFGCEPADIVCQLGPCIRPPLYEIDFATEILAQARAAGLREVHDCQTCTGANVDRYYSYRVEKGQTGRLLALLALV